MDYFRGLVRTRALTLNMRKQITEEKKWKQVRWWIYNGWRIPRL